MKSKLIATTTLCAWSTLGAGAQGTIQEFRNAMDVQKRFHPSFVIGGEIKPTWCADNTFWYSKYTPDGKRYFYANASTPAKSFPLFDSQKLADALSANSSLKGNPRDIQFSSLSVTPRCDTLRFVYADHN